MNSVVCSVLTVHRLMQSSIPAALLLGASLMSLMIIPRPAVAELVGAIPDSATMAMLRQAGEGRGLQVIGTFGQREVRHAVMDSTGMWSSDWQTAANVRPALITTKDTPRPAVPAPLAWSQIEVVKTRGDHKLRGAVVGAAVGLASVAVAFGSDPGEEGAGGGMFVTSAVLGAVIGTFIGSLSGSKTIYRAQESP